MVDNTLLRKRGRLGSNCLRVYRHYNLPKPTTKEEPTLIKLSFLGYNFFNVPPTNFELFGARVYRVFAGVPMGWVLCAQYDVDFFYSGLGCFFGELGF